MDILPPPMMAHMVMVRSEQSLRHIHIVVVRTTHTAMKRLYVFISISVNHAGSGVDTLPSWSVSSFGDDCIVERSCDMVLVWYCQGAIKGAVPGWWGSGLGECCCGW